MSSNRTIVKLLALVLLLAASPGMAREDKAHQEDVTEMYRDTAGRIIGAAMTDQEGWQKLTYLTTVIGNRLSGSPSLQRAVQWAHETMQAEGLSVRLQPVKVPHWVRGEESLEVVAPRSRKLPMLGLGGSVGTGPEGITAPAVVVQDWSELEALPRESVEGRIVVYAVDWEGYGKTVQYRSDGAVRAAAKGAVAALVRSATGRSLATPHTGSLRYAEGSRRIPGAAITVEDALWFRRMASLGQEVTLHLVMGAQTLPDADSANVIAEIRGREKPQEVVVMGGHFDSWDVGQGAHDDGASAMAAWQALKLIRDLGLQPRRTLRVVLWTNEENGLAGGRAYRRELGDAVDHHVAAIEMDGGAERPVGFGFGGTGGRPGEGGGKPPSARALALVRQIGELFDGIDASEVTDSGGGADISPLMEAGVPGMALQTVEDHYFDWHHTNADTLDKVEPVNYRKAVAMLGVMGYVLADMDDTLRD